MNRRLAHTLATETAAHVRTRPIPERKKLLLAAHKHLLESNQVVLFLRPGDYSATEWKQLRGQLPQTEDNPLKLTVLRPGLLPPLIRSLHETNSTANSESSSSANSTASTSTSSASSASSSSSIDFSHLETNSHLKGPLAVLTSPSLDPNTLSRVLKILTKFSQLPSRNAPPVDPKAKGKVVEKTERLELLSGLIEKRAVSAERTIQVGKLPSLDILRAQIVGLLSASGARITGVLGARAFQVGRTLEGFKQGLEEAAPSA